VLSVNVQNILRFPLNPKSVSLFERALWFFTPVLFAVFLIASVFIGKPILACIPCILILLHMAIGHFGLCKALAAFSISTGLLYYFKGIPGYFTLFPLEMLIIGFFLVFPVFIRENFREFISSIRFKKSICVLVFSIVITTYYLINQTNIPLASVTWGSSKVVIFLLGYGVVYYLLFYRYITLKNIFNWIPAAGLLFIMMMVAAYWKGGYIHTIFNERLGTSIGINATLIAMVMDMVLPVCLFSALYCTKDRVSKFAMFFSLLLISVSLLLTYARGSYFGLIALALYFMFRKIKLYTIAVIVIVAALSGPAILNGLQNRFNKQEQHGVALSNYQRLELGRAAIAIIKSNHFIFGNGMLTFSKAKYKFDFPGWLDRTNLLSTHSLYLEHFVGLGFFGFLGMLLLMFVPIYSLLRLKVEEEDRPFRLGLIFSLLSCALHGFVDCQVGFISFSMLLFTILASSAFLITKYKTLPS
jgi:hypothetical protein